MQNCCHIKITLRASLCAYIVCLLPSLHLLASIYVHLRLCAFLAAIFFIFSKALYIGAPAHLSRKQTCAAEVSCKPAHKNYKGIAITP